MKTYCLYILVVSAVFCSLLELGDARGGGRGRGGGSFGGLFGNFRKYKKLSSTGSGRRTVNGSPMQPIATKPVKPSTPIQAKPPPTYPKKAPPPSYASSGGVSSYSNYYGGAAGATHLPPGGSYYANGAAMPPGALYYAQAPMRSSSGTGDFLFGMMAGHVLSRAMAGPRVHHVTHVHRQEDDNRPQVIIINNNNNTTNATTDSTTLWPMADFNVTVAPAPNSEAADSAATQTEQPAIEPPAGGIICVPVLLNVTNPNDESQPVQQVEKILCYPAPPPPPTELHSPTNCTEPQFLDGAGVQDEDQDSDCWYTLQGNQLATTEPPQIAGEIAIE